MKIALAQLDFHIGNFEKNVGSMVNTIRKAKTQLVDLIIFSELSVCGYPPLDLLDRKEFINHCEKGIQIIATECHDIAAIVGSPSLNKNKGKMLYNSAFFLSNGKVQAIRHKTLLPTYDIFDEYRYFEPNNSFEIVEHDGKKIAITICEDLWYEQPVADTFDKSKLYTISPVSELKKQQPDFIVNIAASPFSYTRIETKKEILSNSAKKCGVPLFYVNQVGANTELIFDGGSMIYNGKGALVEQLKKFKTDFNIYELEAIKHSTAISKHQDDVISGIHNGLVLGIKDYFSKMNFSKAVLGLSGGVDSAVTLALAERALCNSNMHVLLMPSIYSSDHSVEDAKTLAEKLKVSYDIIPIKDIVNSADQALTPIFKNLPPGVAEENVQARIRGTLLMAYSNKFNHILLNTSNKSEAAVGYSTLYGDMNGGLSVLGDVYKTDVYKLARYINRNEEIIPENTITKPPSAELRPDQKDSDSLPDYDVLDKILFQYIELHKSTPEIIEHGFDEKLTRKIVKMVNNNEYKRYQTPPILRISSKAFGPGRRMPLVAAYSV